MELFKILGKIAIDGVDDAKKGLGGVGKVAASAGKAIAKGLAVGAGACVGLAAAAIKSYADYEQLVGGVETLFGTRGAKSVQEYADMVGKSVKDVEAEFGMLQEAQNLAMENASNAYKTAGMSANEYMESVNGIAAALNQSSGSQLESAKLANQAVIDMSDNAAKMGTSMEAIQNAYAGFSKQNYTMLDNLKLGYGGTKEEMERLLKDAEKISGIKYDISSFADVTEAIHVMQEEMGIAGTTAKEAAGTIQGSFGMLKGAWSNLMTGLSDPSADLESLINNVFESATTLAGNLVPRITQVLKGIAKSFETLVPMLAGEIPNLFQQVLPSVVDGAVALVNGLVSALPGVVSAITAALPMLIEGVATIITGIAQALPQMIQTIVSALPGVIQTIIDALLALIPEIANSISQSITAIAEALPTLIPQLVNGITQLFTALVAALPTLLQPIIDALPTIIISVVEALVQNLPAIIEGLIQLIMAIVAALPQIIQALVDALPTVISLLVQAILGNLPAIIAGLVQVVMGIVAALPQILGSLISAIPAALQGVWDGISAVFAPLGEWFGEKFGAAKDAAVKAWENIKEKFNEIKNKVTEGFSDLKDKVGEKFNEAKEKAQEKWNDAKAKFTEVKNKVVEGFSTLKENVGTKFSEAKDGAVEKWNDIKSKFESIKGKVVEGFSTLKENVGSKFNDAKNGAVQKWNDIKSKFSTIKNNVVSAFSDLGSKLKTKFESAKSTAISAFNDIKSKVTSVGKNLVEGIWSGISGNLQWIKNKIKGWVGDVTAFLKNLFGIESPSKLMRDEVGRYIAEGVAVGIEENTSEAEKAAEEMSKKVLDAAQKRLDDYKTYNELTLADEVGFWDEVRLQIEEGTDARLAADKKYLDAKKAFNDEIASADAELQQKLEEIYQKIEDKSKDIASTFDLFEGPELDEWLTPGDMFNKLESQVDLLEVYNKHIEELRGKIGGTDLFKELEGKGLQALPQIFAINNMDINYLNKYLELYNERSQLAKDLAANSLADETAAETAAAYEEYAAKMAELGVEIIEETEGMKTEGISNLNEMLSEFTKSLEEFSPKMKLPHFSISGSLDIAQGTVPTVSVEWFKKAMDNAMLLDKPTIFGYNSANGKLLGAGEAGSEVVAGSTTLMNMIQNAVAEQNGTLNYYLQKIVELLATFFPEQIESFRNMKVQLNTGALVGELVVPMDEALGILSERKDRGI
jgi:phage-related protein